MGDPDNFLAGLKVWSRTEEVVVVAVVVVFRFGAERIAPLPGRVDVTTTHPPVHEGFHLLGI